MKRLLKNGTVVNVFSDTLEKENVLIENNKIIGVGDYSDTDADIVEDLSGKFICPGFIDGHIHIESSMLKPSEFARACLPHGTTGVITDPHEIANVAGLSGVEYMLEASEGLPLDVYIMMPSCVPATPLDENAATLTASEIESFYSHPRVLGLAEMMNFPGVVADDLSVKEKLSITEKAGVLVNGHAPGLTGNALDKYIAAGIADDHECTNIDEALEKLKKGQIIMIRQGTAAKDLKALISLFDEPYSHRCILVTDDKEAAQVISNGHIDSIIRTAVSLGKSVITGIRMATLQAAIHFGLRNTGAIAPGYKADILVLDDLENVAVCDVYHNGEKVVSNREAVEFNEPEISAEILNTVKASFHMPDVKESDFYIEPQGEVCNVIKVIPRKIVTERIKMNIDFNKNNGIDIDRDILKIAVIERHNNTGHIGLGFINGTGMKRGALASSVSHDSHNLIVLGTNEADMTVAANHIKKIGGGLAVVENGEVIADIALPIGGLMSMNTAQIVAEENENVRKFAKSLGTAENIEPFMNLMFVSLPVIPELKLTTHGLVDVFTQQLVPLFDRS